MVKKRNLMGLAVILILSFLLSGCGGNINSQNDASSRSEKEKVTNSEGKQVVKIGCMRITEAIIDIITEEMADSEYEIEKVMFDGTSNIPATALNDGSIDGFVVNHLQWVEVFNEKNNSNLKMVEPYVYYFKNGVYSSKYDSIDELPDGAQVAIPADPNNMDRSLRLLQRMGLIKIDEEKKLCNIVDIIENPKNIELIETEITATVKSLYDVDMIISGANAMRLAGEDFNNSLFDDPVDKEFPISLTVREETENEDWVKVFMEATQTESFKNKFNEHYKGTFILFDN
ncbi:MetQ/NlpA family ABC transporter substrate-binding protein [Tissierella praeacuta]|uniref:MetQ/NlpA family ABC transporter substrate-binding protein n=1 Tax=Tissierella praeacuta TaxID=43131 RepID=UPI0028A58851|nr:MetQ/NlpA family ABC transporter substrate-binding protein [Tissierella praeacuta]